MKRHTRKYEVWGNVDKGAYCLATHAQVARIFGPDQLPWDSKLIATFDLPDDESAYFMYQKYLEATGYIHPATFRANFDSSVQELPAFSFFKDQDTND